MRPLRVCIDARLDDGPASGVGSVVLGLASGLSRLDDGDEDYLFLVSAGRHEWLEPYLRGPCRLLAGPPPPRPQWRERLKSAPFLRRAWHALSPVAGRWAVAVPRSAGIVEGAGADVMHFTHQAGFLTSIPSIYHPHDLQHLHFPEFFSPRVRMVREVQYRRFCAEARMVAVTASWAKRDLVRQYGLPEEKVHVVPWAPMLEGHPVPSPEQVADVGRRLSLPEPFVFYPAQTWPHKNHLGLLEALAWLRDRHGMRVGFVSSGKLTEFFPQIRRRAEELGLADQVRFVGFVPPLELQCLYRLCRAVVIPTKFEAASFPLWEAFLAGAPAACSNVTSLPEQAGDAALVFDPDQPEEIGAAIRRLWTDEELRRALARRGATRVARFTWERTARTFRAHYRRLGVRPLSAADRELLQVPPGL